MVRFSVFLVLAFTLSESSNGFAADPKQDFARCVYLEKKINRYTRLRRAGGTAARMEGWRSARRRYADEYRERRCHRFGRRLRDAAQSPKTRAR